MKGLSTRRLTLKLELHYLSASQLCHDSSDVCKLTAHSQIYRVVSSSRLLLCFVHGLIMVYVNAQMCYSADVFDHKGTASPTGIV